MKNVCIIVSVSLRECGPSSFPIYKANGLFCHMLLLWYLGSLLVNYLCTRISQVQINLLIYVFMISICWYYNRELTSTKQDFYFWAVAKLCFEDQYAMALKSILFHLKPWCIAQLTQISDLGEHSKLIFHACHLTKGNAVKWFGKSLAFYGVIRSRLLNRFVWSDSKRKSQCSVLCALQRPQRWLLFIQGERQAR